MKRHKIIAMALLIMMPILSIMGTTVANAQVTVTLSLTDLSSASAGFTSEDPSSYSSVTIVPPSHGTLTEVKDFTYVKPNFNNSSAFYAWAHIVGKDTYQISFTGSQLKGTTENDIMPYTFSIGATSKEVTALQEETIMLNKVKPSDFASYWYDEVKIAIPFGDFADVKYQCTLTMKVNVI